MRQGLLFPQGIEKAGFLLIRARPRCFRVQTNPVRNSIHQESSANPPLEAIEAQSFLHDTMNKLDTSYSSTSSVPYKDHTGRQLRHILIGSSFRWFITAGLCAGYILSTIIWQNKGVISENQKKLYNAITTGISIAIGLNIASAFKDMALNMRWPILSARKRSLVEVSCGSTAVSKIKVHIRTARSYPECRQFNETCKAGDCRKEACSDLCMFALAVH